MNEEIQLTDEQLEEWKSQYKRIYRCYLLDGTEIIWRRLNRTEYKQLVHDYQDLEDRDERLWAREEACCRACILYPGKEAVDQILEDNGGIASVLSDEIYEKSGFRLQNVPEEL